MRHKTALKFFLSLFVLTLFLTGCGFPGLSDTSDKNVNITSGVSTESQILANIVSELLKHETDYRTSILNNLGSSTLEHNALSFNDADIMATSYNGTDLTGFLQQPPVKDPAIATKLVNTQLKNKHRQIRFPSYGFSDTYAFMVTQETAKKYHLNTVTDLSEIGPKLTAGVDSSWMARKGDGYEDFTKDYHFKFKSVYPMQIGLVYDAVSAGKMPIVLGYSTDGRIQSYNLKILEDDKHFFPPYNCAPVANEKFLKSHPDVSKLLHRLKGKISVSTMQKLNFQADDRLEEPAVVARNFLAQHNYFR